MEEGTPVQGMVSSDLHAVFFRIGRAKRSHIYFVAGIRDRYRDRMVELLVELTAEQVRAATGDQQDRTLAEKGRKNEKGFALIAQKAAQVLKPTKSPAELSRSSVN